MTETFYWHGSVRQNFDVHAQKIVGGLEEWARICPPNKRKGFTFTQGDVTLTLVDEYTLGSEEVLKVEVSIPCAKIATVYLNRDMDDDYYFFSSTIEPAGPSDKVKYFCEAVRRNPISPLAIVSQGMVFV